MLTIPSLNPVCNYNRSLTIFVTDVDPVPSLSFTAVSPITMSETSPSLNFDLTLSILTTSAVTISLQYGDPNNNLVSPPTSISIAPLEYTTHIAINLQHNITHTGDSDIIIIATNAQGAAQPSPITFHILDADPVPLASLQLLSSSPFAEDSPSPLCFAVSLNRPTTSTVGISLSYTDPSLHLLSTPPSVSLSPLQTVYQINLPLQINASYTGPSQITITAFSASSATLGSPNILSITITDINPVPSLNFLPPLSSNFEFYDNTTSITVPFEITLSGTSIFPVIFNLNFIGNQSNIFNGSSHFELPPFTTTFTFNITLTPTFYGNSSVIISMKDTTNSTLGTLNSIELHQEEHRSPPCIFFPLSSLEVLEGNSSVEITVATSNPIMFDFNITISLEGHLQDIPFGTITHLLPRLHASINVTIPVQVFFEKYFFKIF